MPYEVRQQGTQFCVFTQGTDKSHGCHPQKSQAMDHMRAMYANVKDATESVATERDFTQAQRDKAASNHNALPDGSFPINNKSDLANAIKAYGRAKDQAAAKSHIIKRARALGALDMLPDGWVKGASEGGGSSSPKRRMERQVLVAQEALQFDENGDCTITIVQPGVSVNNLDHTPEAIKLAIEDGIWNNSRMFTDHGDPGNMLKDPFSRKTSELVSIIRDTFLGDDGSAKGRVKFVRKDFRDFAQEAQDVLGVSMATWYEDGGRYRKDGRLITKVKKYLANRSVDWTPFPAAGGGIDEFNLATESMEVEFDDLTVEELTAQRPDLIDAIIAAQQPSPSSTGSGTPPAATESTSPADIQKMIDAAVESRQNRWEADREKERKTRELVIAHLAESGLPIKVQNRLAAQFDGSAEYDESKVEAAVESAFGELAEVGFKKGPKIRGNGSSTADGQDNKPATMEELEANGFDTMVAVESAMGYKAPAGSGVAD